VYEVDTNPITAAANIALNGWTTSDTAVLAVDGSSMTDTTGVLDVDTDTTLNVKTDKTVATPDQLIDFAGKKMCTIVVRKTVGSNDCCCIWSSLSSNWNDKYEI
jgi:hypothetical protein